MGGYVDVLLGVDGGDDDEELDSLRLGLSEELLSLDVHSVEGVAGDAPPGIRALDAAVLGQLLIKAGPGAVLAIVRTVRRWIRRSGARSVELSINGDTIKLSRASDAEQERLLEMFIAKHGSG